MSEPATSPCLGCGRCCFGPVNYVQVFDDDLRVLGPERAAALVVAGAVEGQPPGARSPPRVMRMVDGHCAALDLSGGRFTCSIYEHRPLICRVYQLHGASSVCPPRVPGEPVIANPWRLAPPASVTLPP